jgi:hypothetical protein
MRNAQKSLVGQHEEKIQIKKKHMYKWEADIKKRVDDGADFI